MNFGPILNIVILVGIVAWFGYRQSTWQPIVPGRMWRTPVILGVIGVVMMAQLAAHLSGVDVAVIVIELLISAGVGALMGRIAVFRPLASPVETRRGTATMQSRTGWWGLVLWVVLIVVRIGVNVVAAGLGANVVGATGLILLLLAVNRLTRIAVLEARLNRAAA